MSRERHITASAYLVVDSTGIVKLTKNKPAVNAAQSSIKIEVNLPAAIVSEPPMLATIEIPSFEPIEVPTEGDISEVGKNKE